MADEILRKLKGKEMTEIVALIGAGAMGGAIGTRLVETGNTLNVFDPNPEKVAQLVAKGAVAAGSAAEAAAAADYVITSLNSPQIVERAIFGKDGVADAAKAGTLIIDMSSIDPGATRALAGRAEEKGLRWVDSPLSGGAPKALLGELTLMAGGTAETSQTRTTFSDMWRRTTPVWARSGPDRPRS